MAGPIIESEATFRQQLGDGNFVLFAGAGFSIGATTRTGLPMLTGEKLKQEMAKQFFPELDVKDASLRQVYDHAISTIGSPKVQEYLQARHTVHNIGGFHSTFPRLRWKAIFTINIDTCLERAYEVSTDKRQKLRVFGPGISPAPTDFTEVVLHKVHGDVFKPEAGIVFGAEEYADAIEDTSKHFERFAKLIARYPVLFVGCTLQDADVDLFIRRTDKLLAALKQSRPLSYLADPGAGELLITTLRNKRIGHIRVTTEQLAQYLESEVLPTIPSDADLLKRQLPPGDVFVSNKGFANEYALLFQIHFRLISPEFISKATKRGNLFYRGYEPEWGDIAAELDASRSIVPTLLEECAKATKAAVAHVVLGEAGSGKTTILMRLAFALAQRGDVVIFNRPEVAEGLNYDFVLRFAKDQSRIVYVIIDNASSHIGAIDILLRTAEEAGARLRIIGAERNHEWNEIVGSKQPTHLTCHKLSTLDDTEIRNLSEKLKTHDSLGNLTGKTDVEIFDTIKTRAEKQLLVALLEATKGDGFDRILLDEYKSISSEYARQAYLICAIYSQYQVLLPHELFVQCIGVDSDDTLADLLKHLEGIIIPHAQASKAWFKARHSLIASRISELVPPAEIANALETMLTALDPAASKQDKKVYINLISCETLTRYLKDGDTVRAFYARFEKSFSADEFYWQQRAIAERRFGKAVEALTFIDKALKLAPRMYIVKTTKAVILFDLSCVVGTDKEARDYADQAGKLMDECIEGDPGKEVPLGAYMDGLLKLYKSCSGALRPEIKNRLRDVATRARKLKPRDRHVLTLIDTVNRL